MKRSWKDNEIDYIQFMYGKQIAKYEGHNDDRQIYINIYNMIMEALKDLKKEPNVYIKVAMKAAINKDLQTLDDINKRFENK
jgi:hypothetical protein